MPQQTRAYDELEAKGLKLDLTRGKPSAAQLDLSNELLTLPGAGNYTDAAGTDCRNYGGTQGLLEIREIFAPLLNVPVAQLVAGDNASLSIMHDTIVYSLLKGTTLRRPLGPRADQVPLPGARLRPALRPVRAVRHRDGAGPARQRRARPGPGARAGRRGPEHQGHLDRADVRQPLRLDLHRGRHPGPGGDADRRAGLPDLLGQRVRRPPPDRPETPAIDILGLAAEAGNPDRVFVFASTSKITFAGAGVAFFASSAANVAWYLGTWASGPSGRTRSTTCGTPAISAAPTASAS